MFEQHDVSRRIISSFILYDDVLATTCSIGFGYPFGGLWGKPHVSWCTPLTPNCNFMFPSYEMNMEENKWLVKHLLFLILMQVKDALRWLHGWKYDSLFGCHLATCFHCTLLPYIADMLMFRGSFGWRVGLRLNMPIGSMILPTLHVVNLGGTMGKP